MERWFVLIIFLLDLKISGVAVQETHKNNEKRLLSVRIFFDAVLATFCCYDCGANCSDAVEKMATNQKDHRKSSFHQ